MSKPAQPDYPGLLSEIKARIRSAQYEALKAVNRELVGLYWDIGRMIVGRQSDAKHGAAIAEQLAVDIQAEFSGIRGFSRRNVFYMREFYLVYRNDERVQPLVAQIGWSHNLVIFQHRNDPQMDADCLVQKEWEKQSHQIGANRRNLRIKQEANDE